MYQTLQMLQCFWICDWASKDMFSIAFLLYYVMCPMGQKVKDVFINKISENQICEVCRFYSSTFKSSFTVLAFTETFCQTREFAHLSFNVRFLLSVENQSVSLHWHKPFSGFHMGSPTLSLTEANPCHGLPGPSGPARNPSRTGPLLPERAVVECEGICIHPKKRL